MENLNTHKDTFLAKWLEGDLSNEELRALVSPEDYRAFLKLKRGLEVSAALDESTDASFAKIKQRIDKKKNKSKVLPMYAKWIGGMAASILILFGVFNYFSDSTTIIQTNFGEMKNLTLMDGSEVILNAKSQLSFEEDSWENNRTINLEGEAYFKVAKGKTFTVKTPNGSVEVLGTEFNVNSNSDFFDVTCFEGKVKVTTSDATEHVLLPNSIVRKVNGNPTENYVSNQQKPTWINGESSFKSVPLYLVIDALEKEYGVSFETENMDTTVIYSGAFPHQNLEVALQTVFTTLGIQYEITKGNNIKLKASK